MLVIELAQGWMAWRWFVLRSAGFPAGDVLALGADASSRAIDRWLDDEAALDVARAAALDLCGRALHAVDYAERKPWMRRIKHLRAGRFAECAAELATDAAAAQGSAALATELGDAVAVLVARQQQLAAARAALEPVLAADGRAIAETLRGHARDPRFCEAIAWQNRALLRTLIDPLLAAPPDATDSPVRQKQATIAGYVQRYCVKNDTIGFFGPIVWARIGDVTGEGRHDELRVRPSARLLDMREVCFEYWGIDTLATVLAEDAALRRVLAPRALSTVRLADDVLHYPVARTAQLEAPYVALIAACDGHTPAEAIARALAAEPALGVDEAEIYEMLDELVAQRVVRWAIELPTMGNHPERHLRRALEALPAIEARARALHVLDELEAARDRVAAAAGDPAAVDRALRALDERFSQLTGAAAARNAGQMYAARTLVYEDTRRDLDVVLPDAMFERLGAPLALMLQSGRWFTHATATAYLPVFAQVHRALRAQTGRDEIDYLQYLEQLLPHFAVQESVAPTMRPIIAELQRKWVEVLGVRDGGPAIVWRSDELRARVMDAFAAPTPGWPQARYHAPDLMISARGVEALRRGELTFVMGEFHTGVNTCMRPVSLQFHPDAEPLLALRRHELGRPAVTTVEARAHALRTDHFAPMPDDFDIETTDARSWRAAGQVLPAAQLVVVERDGRVEVHTRDGRHRFDAIAAFEGYLQLASETHYSMLPAMTHVPRVTIDDLVVARASWTFAPSELAFATANGTERFVGARRWARARGLPRCVFVRVPQEPKPVYVDLESPIYVESFAKLVRQASVVKLSEMLPQVDETWLPDGEGRTYTSELRMALVDPIAWQPPGG